MGFTFLTTSVLKKCSSHIRLGISLLLLLAMIQASIYLPTFAVGQEKAYGLRAQCGNPEYPGKRGCLSPLVKFTANKKACHLTRVVEQWLAYPANTDLTRDARRPLQEVLVTGTPKQTAHRFA